MLLPVTYGFLKLGFAAVAYCAIFCADTELQFTLPSNIRLELSILQQNEIKRERKIKMKEWEIEMERRKVIKEKRQKERRRKAQHAKKMKQNVHPGNLKLKK